MKKVTRSRMTMRRKSKLKTSAGTQPLSLEAMNLSVSCNSLSMTYSTDNKYTDTDTLSIANRRCVPKVDRLRPENNSTGTAINSAQIQCEMQDAELRNWHPHNNRSGKWMFVHSCGTNSKGEKIKIRLVTFPTGPLCFDIRTYYVDKKTGETKEGKGVCMSVDKIHGLIFGLQKALKLATDPDVLSSI